jgi:ABC-type bacteriocin/lantibiotic exporter with double-glycine peptidase domain
MIVPGPPAAGDGRPVLAPGNRMPVPGDRAPDGGPGRRTRTPAAPAPPARGQAALGRLRLFKQKTPFVAQLSADECGAACLAMVLARFGRREPLEELRSAVLGKGAGTDALSLVTAGRRYGLRARGVRCEVDDAAFLPPGSILHWEFNHFVVFERHGRGGIEILDPAVGRRRISHEQFRKSFTGVALLFAPGDEFKVGGKAQARPRDYLRRFMGHPAHLARVILLSAVLQMVALGLPFLTGSIVDRVVPRADHYLLLTVAACVLPLLLFQFVASYVRSLLLLVLRVSADGTISVGFFDHLLRLPFSYFQQRSTGDLLMRLSSSTIIRETLTSAAMASILDGVMVLIYAGALFATNPRIGALALGIGVVQSAVTLATRGRRRELAAEQVSADAEVQGYQTEVVGGVEAIKACGAADTVVEHWSNLFVRALNTSIDRDRLEALVGAGNAALGMGAPLAILLAGAWLVLGGEMPVGRMLATSGLAGGFLGSLASIVSLTARLQIVGTYVDRVMDVLGAAPEQAGTPGLSAHRFGGRVALESVDFRYNPDSPLIVENLTLDVRPGEFVAVVGRSGAGKSTLARLVLGLCQPTAGRVLWDGIELGRCDLAAMRSQVGVVTQNAPVLGMSVRENITLTHPEADLAAVLRAAQMAGIHEEIMALPMGYETRLPSGGSSLSGGQRQRLALARALVGSPALLVLDEATSAMDAITEAHIQSALARLRCTRIVIAHRLSTIRDADRIVVMEKGRIAECGSHAELVGRDGIYAALVKKDLR